MLNLSVLQSFMDSYEYSHRMPFTSLDIYKIVNECIELASQENDSVPEGFFQIMGDFRDHLNREDVFLTGVTRASTGSTAGRLILKFMAGETGGVFSLQFSLSFKRTIETTSLTVTSQDQKDLNLVRAKTMSETFSVRVIEEVLDNSKAVYDFNAIMIQDINDLFPKLELGRELKNIDFIKQYGVGPEADFIKSLARLTEDTDGQVVMASRTGNSLLLSKTYTEGKPSLSVAPSAIKTILLGGSSFNDTQGRETLSVINEQVKASGSSLIAVSPLTSGDFIAPDAKLVTSPDILSAYLDGATTDELNDMLEIISRKGFDEYSLPADVLSVIQRAQLRNMQDEYKRTSPRKKLFFKRN